MLIVSFNLLLCLVEQGKEFLLGGGLEDADAGLSEVGDALEEGAVGQMAAHVDDAAEFGALAFLQGVVGIERVGHTLLHLSLQHVKLPVEGHGVIVTTCVEIGAHVPEEPRLTESGATYHDGIDTIAVEGSLCLFGCADVAVADDGDVDALTVLHLADESPVGLTLIHLGASTTMDGECFDAAVLKPFGKFEDKRLTFLHRKPFGWHVVE